MYERLIGQTLSKMTKLLLASAGPLQCFLDSPGLTHVHCLEQAYNVLKHDGKEDVAKLFNSHHTSLTKGLYWADRGWKNVNHFYSDPSKQGIIGWPGATAECQYYFNKAFTFFPNNVYKGMFFLGAALHLLQDMCVPHHSLGVLFDGHKEFETWATKRWDKFPAKSGMYMPFSHPAQWIDHNASVSAPLYPLVSLCEGCNAESYTRASEVLIPLTISTSAGFLDFARKRLLRFE
ncbi:zinc dependent phospholipase C family protein [Desulfosporosinus sp.]|uniref:zinc dependent phospholipase C family protein n=1 Tax=Desulfosporosinus sp. TaxID=157907 RepID=UPI0025B9527D|nr:zinc dependent phospholipase C family protein [Desulfosporosinus sp.]MBC2725361.1 zinc dependent phospholipase C family protein [Desulfosporosinus sp.]